MRILVLWELRSQPAFSANQRTSHGLLFAGSLINLLERMHNQTADRGAGALGSVAQPIVEWIRNIDRGSNCHNMIMAQVT